MITIGDSATAGAAEERLTPLGILHILRRRWLWALAASLLTLSLGLLPLLQPARYSAIFTVRGLDNLDLSALYRPGALTRRDPLAQQVAQGIIDIRMVSYEPAEQTFALSASDPAVVQLGVTQMESVAKEIEQADRELANEARASANEYLAMQVASYEELRNLMLSSLQEATPAGYGDLPSTIFAVTKLLLPLQNELNRDPAKEERDDPRIVAVRSDVVMDARPASLLAIGMIGVALAVGLLVAIVVDAAVRVRRALSAT